MDTTPKIKSPDILEVKNATLSLLNSIYGLYKNFHQPTQTSDFL